MPEPTDTTPAPAPAPVAHATPCGPNVCGVVTHEGAAPEPEPGLREQVAQALHDHTAAPGMRDRWRGLMADYLRAADAVLTVRDAELERMAGDAQWNSLRYEGAERRIQQLLGLLGEAVDWIPEGEMRERIVGALDGQEQLPVNPPGSTQEQLPAGLLALLPARSYLSTACEVARLLEGAAIANPERAAELREWRDRMYARCRLNNKYTGALCTGSYHKEQP